MAYGVPPLPYAHDALEPTVDEVLRNLSSLPEDKQVGWEAMHPNGGGRPDGELAAASDAAFDWGVVAERYASARG